MKWIKRGVYLGIYLLSVVSIQAEPVEKMFFDANKYYDEGSYENAIDTYEAILEKGIRSGNIYYNRANAYFKLGKIGHALANYERALKYTPQDEDLFANIQHVKSLMVDSQPHEIHPWYELLYIDLRDLISPNLWLLTTYVLYCLSFIFLTCAIFIRRFKKHFVRTTIALLVLTVLNAFMTGKSIQEERYSKYAIIVLPEVEVRYSPSYDGAVAFKLHEGIKVKVISNVKDWHQVKIVKGKSGWIQKESIEVI